VKVIRAIFVIMGDEDTSKSKRGNAHETQTPEKKRVTAHRIEMKGTLTPLHLDDIISITALCARCDEYVKLRSGKK
jgi:hypothetical protein